MTTHRPLCAVFLMAVALSALATSGRAQAPARTIHFPPADELASFVRAQVEKRRVAGMVIGVLETDGTKQVVAYGNPGPGARALDGRSIFEIGSATKAFTGTLLAVMIADGAVALDDPVTKYLPSGVTMPTRGGRQITLVDLATHHSGLPRMPEDHVPADPANPYADFTVEKMYAFLLQYRLPREIGSQGEYSNLGMGLLGHVLARAAGKSYEELLRERILAPLGMRATSTVLDGERRELMVKGHNRELVVVPLYDAPAIAGAGLLKSNAADLLTFVDANAGPPTSPQERAFRESHRIQKRLSEELSIGLAWQISTLGGGESIVMHAGGTGGFQSFIGFDPNKQVGAVVLINTKAGSRSDALDIGMHLINPRMVPLR